MSRGEKRKRIPTIVKWIIVIVPIVIAFFLGTKYLLAKYEVKTVYVDGNVHYTEDEIKKIVMEGKFGNNSLYLSIKYKNRDVKNIPFVETMDVKILSPDTIRISVYEKALAGFVEYLSKYIYFDKDGIVVESSNVKTAGVPQVVGMSFDYIVLYEPLPVKDSKIFKDILDLTQWMTKYEVQADKIYFKNDKETILYYEKIKVNVGASKDMDLKIMNLGPMLQRLTGMSGTLHMENYNEENSNASFEPDS